MLKEITFQSPATGRWYWIDAKGIATPEVREDYEMCECEMDWNCPMHSSRIGTWIETRYAGMDSDEAIAYGRMVDA